MKPYKVLLLEFNEITWRLIEPLIVQGKMPHFQRLREEGAWGTAVASEVPPHLDPWVTWVTVHTGVERDMHGATVLEQKGETIRAKRTWQYVAEAGKSVGVFGSITAYPPQPVAGFMVPGPFAPGGETYPRYLEPIQQLNQRYTRVHNKLDRDDSLAEMLRQGVELFGLGLKPSTVARLAAQLLRERWQPHQYWKRVALQPLVNFDFFDALYERYRPDFATWHTNHAAHYMHHYWRAHDDRGFLVRASEQEKRKFGGAVEHGYRVADELLGRFMSRVDEDTVLVVASSMGQKPYVNDAFRAGRYPVRFKDVRRVLGMVGAKGVEAVQAVMAPQWNVVIGDDEARLRAKAALERCERHWQGHVSAAFAVTEVEGSLTVTPAGLPQEPDDSIRYFFPGLPGERREGYAFDELFAADQPTPKQGMHDPPGVLAFWGAPIVARKPLGEVRNIDIAPTLLTLLGIAPPAVMSGRVLCEAWGDDAISNVTRRAHAAA